MTFDLVRKWGMFLMTNGLCDLTLKLPDKPFGKIDILPDLKEHVTWGTATNLSDDDLGLLRAKASENSLVTRFVSSLYLGPVCLALNVVRNIAIISTQLVVLPYALAIHLTGRRKKNEESKWPNGGAWVSSKQGRLILEIVTKAGICACEQK